MLRPQEQLYKRELGEIAADLDKYAFEASQILKTEEEFKNKAIIFGNQVKAKYHDNIIGVFAGAPFQEIRNILEELKPSVRELKWSLEGYTLAQNQEPKIKIPVTIAILHGVYDFLLKRVFPRVVIQNPELHTYIRMQAETLGRGLTTKIPGNYIKVLYGPEEETTRRDRSFTLLKLGEVGL